MGLANELAMLTLLVAAITYVGATAGGGVYNGGSIVPRKLEQQLESRHQLPYGDRTASKQLSKSQFAELMISKCHPEADGYFGSTSGTPLVLQYAYEMETTPTAKKERAQELLNGRIMDAILVKIFPGICGYSYRKLSDSLLIEPKDQGGKVTGFLFRQHQLYWKESCLPSVTEASECGIYYSSIAVYGHDLHSGTCSYFLNLIREALMDSLNSASQEGVARLEVYEKLTKQISGPSDGKMSSTGAKLGLAVGVFIVLLGILSLFVCMLPNKPDYKEIGRSKERLMTPPRPIWRLPRRFFRNRFASPPCDQTAQTASISHRDGPSIATTSARRPLVVAFDPARPADNVYFDMFSTNDWGSVGSGSIIDEYSEYRSDPVESRGLL